MRSFKVLHFMPMWLKQMSTEQCLESLLIYHAQKDHRCARVSILLNDRFVYGLSAFPEI